MMMTMNKQITTEFCQYLELPDQNYKVDPIYVLHLLPNSAKLEIKVQNYLVDREN